MASEQPAGYVCDGCGRLARDPEQDIQKLREDNFLSCCPERKMLPVYTHPAPAATDTGLETVVDRYRKKSFEVEAIQYTGENLEQVLEFTGKHPSWDGWFKSFDDYFKHVSSDGFKFKIIGGPYGTEIAVPGDWIIKRDGGRVIVCKPLTFADRFEPLFTRDAPGGAK